MWTERDAEIHAKGYASEDREWDKFALELGLTADLQRVVHFVRFTEHDQHYQNAVRIWGAPHFVHRHWDQRAQSEVALWDIVVFAKGDSDQHTIPYAYDDSNERHDPAYWERING